MIEITRSLTRRLKTIFRRTISETGRGIVNEPVLFHAGPDGLHVRIASRESATEYHDPTARSPDAATVPFEFLSDCEGRNDDPVQLETSGGNEVLATWNHNSVPQMVRYSVPEVQHHFPDLPESFVENPPYLIAALHDSMQTAAPESIRYALHYVQFRGSGAIAATDGRQLLLQSGFEFPWDEDVLIPSRSVFGSKELPQDQPVFVGGTEKSVCFRIGVSSFLFAIESEARFPHVDDNVRRPNDATSSIQFATADAAFLRRSLRNPPCDDDLNYPVTVDLNGCLAVRAKSADTPHPVELVLTRSTSTGQDVCINTNRKYLDRAIQLGFRKVHIFNPEAPALCQDERRSYVWALLTAGDIVKPTPDTIRIESPQPEATQHSRQRTKERKGTKVTKTPSSQTNDAGMNGKATCETGVDELIDQAEQIKVSLRDSLTKTSEMVASLKRHRKQSKLVRSTLQSLRQLHTLDA